MVEKLVSKGLGDRVDGEGIVRVEVEVGMNDFGLVGEEVRGSWVGRFRS